MKVHALLFVLLSLSACSTPGLKQVDSGLVFPSETHFKTLRQLTFGGSNAEAYWSFDGKNLSFQHKGAPLGAQKSVPACDQIYSMNSAGSKITALSSGSGRTTCSFYFPDQSRILFSSTAQPGTHEACPENPNYSRGYVWPIYDTYQIYSVKPDGTDMIPLEPGAPRAYNAETTLCSDRTAIFTSDRDGDLELYTAKIEKLGTLTDIKRITHEVGYDGGAVFSPDCKQIAWRASRPRPGKEKTEYLALLKKHQVRPTELEIWTADVDGSNAHQVTDLGGASFAPTFSPDAKNILFSSNFEEPYGRKFNLYSVATNGTGLTQITDSKTFDSFPMFSPNGKELAFSSNRNGKEPHETNVFVAEWQNAEKPVIFRGEDRFMHVIETLSVPTMEGRGLGTTGLKHAEEFIASQFQEIGLHPYFGKSFFQEVKSSDPTTHQEFISRNVVSSLGKACAAPVVIGAHLDHLGYGGPNSLEPSTHGIHPGADDNASGVAGILEIARILKTKSDAGCVLFAAFTGEEIGTSGSSRFVDYLKSKSIHPRAMLNLDMIGRMRDNQLITFGTDSAREWKSIVDHSCEVYRLHCSGGGDGYGPSDHMPFYIAKVPVIHFFTGPHLDYHRTTDTADKINATGGVQAAQLIAMVARMSQKETLHYVRASAKPSMGALRDSKGASTGAYLGTIPDYSKLTSPHGPGEGKSTEGGVALSGVRPGSPADRAGVLAGDVLLGISDAAGAPHRIETLEQFMQVLTPLHPGDQVILRVLRNGKEIQIPAVVGKRT